MIPVAPGFFKPQLVAAPPGDDITCEDTYGETFYTEFFDTFGTNGNLSGASAETSPNDSWTYSATSAVRSGGVVSPATFTASGDQVVLYKALVSVNMASGETLTMDFAGGGYTLQVVLALGAGDACSFSFVGGSGTVTDTFSIGASAGEVTIGFNGYRVFHDPDYEMYLYVSPDLVSTPAATIVEGADSFPSSYTQMPSFEFSCTGSNTSINFVRVCGNAGG